MANPKEPKPAGTDEGTSGDAVEDALKPKVVPFFEGNKHGTGAGESKGGFAEAEESANIPVKQEGWP